MAQRWKEHTSDTGCLFASLQKAVDAVFIMLGYCASVRFGDVERWVRKEFLVRQNEISFSEGKGVGEQFMLKVLERRKARLVCVHCKNAKEKKKEANDDYDAHLQFFSTLMGFPPPVSSSISWQAPAVLYPRWWHTVPQLFYQACDPHNKAASTAVWMQSTRRKTGKRGSVDDRVWGTIKQGGSRKAGGCGRKEMERSEEEQE